MESMFSSHTERIWVAIFLLILGGVGASKNLYGADGPTGPIGVIQIRNASDKPQSGTSPYILTLDQPAVMDVREPHEWFTYLYSLHGGDDPRTKLDPETNMAVAASPDVRKILDKINATRNELAKISGTTADDIAERDQIQARIEALKRYSQEYASTGQVEDWLSSCILSVNGKEFPDIHPKILYWWDEWDANGSSYSRYCALGFEPTMTDENKPTWLGLFCGQGFTPLRVAVTIEDQDLFPNHSDAMPTFVSQTSKQAWQKVYLRVATFDRMTAGMLGVFIVVAVFLLLATGTRMLWDLGSDQLWHLSLGRCQMAFWFLAILFSFVFLWIVTGDYGTLTEQELILLGISASTGLGSVLINNGLRADDSRRSSVLPAQAIGMTNPNEIEPLIAATKDEIKRLNMCLDGESDAKEYQNLQDKLQRSQARLFALKRRQAYFRPGIQNRIWQAARDLVEETDRPSLHRFQMIAWTGVLGVIFISTVYSKLAMPRFDSAILAMMGISSGTYLGFKWPTASAGENPNA